MPKQPKNKFLFLAGLILLFSFLFVPGAWAESGEWDQFQNDLYNSGVTYDAGPIHSVQKAWKEKAETDAAGMGAGVNSTPLVAEGKVFVIGAKADVRAFDAKTGEELWRRDLSCTNQQFQLVTPAYAEGKLFVGTNDGWVYALKGSDGSVIWGKQAFTHRYSQLYTPIKCAGGKIYLGSWNGDNSYYCFDAATGEQIWKRKATSGNLGYYWSGACVVGDYLIFGDMNSYLTCLNKDTGFLVDEVNLKTIESGVKQVNATVSYNPDTKRFYVPDESGICWAFNLDENTGKFTHAWHKKLDNLGNSTPAFYQGKIYLGTGKYSSRGHFYCLDEASGAEIWKYTPTGGGESSVVGIQSSPALSVQGDQIYLYFLTNCETSKLYCLDGDGNLMWEYRSEETGTPSYTTSSVAVADGWLYFGNDGGFVYGMRKAKEPDLTVGELKFHALYANKENDLPITVKNEGEWEAKAFEVAFWAGEELIATQAVTGLAAGEEKEVTFYWTPPKELAEKDAALKFIVDFSEQVKESDERNNETTTGVPVVLLAADLKVQRMDTPEVLLAGEEATVVGVVYNIGNMDAGPFQVDFSVDEEKRDSRTVSALVYGMGQEMVFQWTPSHEGSFRLGMTVDGLDNDEVERENNQFAKTVQVGSGGGDSGSGGSNGGKITVHLEIQDMYGETRFDDDVKVDAGATVYDVLVEAAKSDKKMKIKFDPDNPHIFGGYLWSMYGQDSPWGEQADGWIFLVNKEMTKTGGAAKTKVKDGDDILWAWGDMSGPKPREKPAGSGSSTPVSDKITAQNIADAHNKGDTRYQVTMDQEISIEKEAWNKAVGLKMDLAVALKGEPLSLVIPPDAFQVTGTLTLKGEAVGETERQQLAGFLPEDRRLAGKIYRLSLGQKEGTGEKAVTWKKSVTLVFSYQGLAVDHEEDLMACYYDETARTWQEIAGSQVDKAKKEVRVMAPHFSQYALVEKVEPGAAAVQTPGIFTDLPENHWAKKEIDFLMVRGYFTGYPDGTCRPDHPVTRAEFAALLVRALGLPAETGTRIFEDVPESKWFFSVVSAAYRGKLVKGYTEKQFRPDEKITREQAAVMLKEALALKGKSLILSQEEIAERLHAYPDRKSVSAWAEEALAAVSGQGLMSGFPDGTVRPKDTATRAQCAVMLQKLLD